MNSAKGGLLMPSNIIELNAIKGEARVDSRLIARDLGNQHDSVVKLVEDYRSDFEEFGIVCFQSQPKADDFPDFKSGNSRAKTRRGRPERFALLNEDQAYLLLTYSRNTPEARRLKISLVKAFSRFREGKQVAAGYLPFYHALHDEVGNLAMRARLAGSTTPEEHFHSNMNRLLNKAFGVELGARAGLSPMRKVLLSGAQALAAETLGNALAEGLGHREAYARVKAAVERYAAGGLASLPPSAVH